MKYLLSYHSGDRGLVTQLINALVNVQACSWNELHDYARDATRTGSGLHELTLRLDEVDYVIAVISSSSNVHSDLQHYEIQTALHRQNLVPVVIDHARIPHLYRVYDPLYLSKHSSEADITACAIAIRERRLALPSSRRLRFDFHTYEPRPLNHLFVGRDEKLAALTDAWKERRRIVCIVAEGGTGKSSLVSEWLRTIGAQGFFEADQGFLYSFYKQGVTHETNVSPDQFFLQAANVLAGQSFESGTPLERAVQAVTESCSLRRTLLVLDGLEPNQLPPDEAGIGAIIDPTLRRFIENFIPSSLNGLCIITTRVPYASLSRDVSRGIGVRLDLEPMDQQSSVALIQKVNADISKEAALDIADDTGRHPVLMILLAQLLLESNAKVLASDVRRAWQHRDPQAQPVGTSASEQKLRDLLHTYTRQGVLSRQARQVLNVVCLFDGAVRRPVVDLLLSGRRIASFTEWKSRGPLLSNADRDKFRKAVSELVDKHLLTVRTEDLLRLADLGEDVYETTLLRSRQRSGSAFVESYDTHALIRGATQYTLRSEARGDWRRAHRRLFLRKHWRAWKLRDMSVMPSERSHLLRLYSAVPHGVEAGHAILAGWLYGIRCLRGFRAYSTNHHAMIGYDKDVLSHYFAGYWKSLRPDLRLNAYARVQALAWGGMLLIASNDYARGKQLMIDAYRAAVESGNVLTAARTNRNLAMNAMVRGELDFAEQCATDALTALSRPAGWVSWVVDEMLLRVNRPFQEMATHNVLGSIAMYRGDESLAARHFEAALRIQRRAVPRAAKPLGLWCLRYVEYLLWSGRQADAMRVCAEALTDPERPKGWGEGVFGTPCVHLATAMVLLNGDSSDAGGVERARTFLESAIRGIESQGRLEFLRPLVQLLEIRLRRRLGHYDEAQTRIADLRQRVAATGELVYLPDVSMEEACIALAKGETMRARVALRDGMAFCDQHGLHGKAVGLRAISGA